MRTKDGITLADVYDVVNRLEDKIDRRLKDVEEKVEVQESFRNRAMALIGVASAFSGIISAWVWDRILGKS